MPKELISVIVPVYNVEKYISQCIESILNQSYSNIELILVDDGSGDKSGEICDAYAENDNRIVVVHQKNSGASFAKNAGLDIAKGKYISFLDSDDFLADGALEYLYEKVKENDVLLAIGREQIVDESGRFEDSVYSDTVNEKILSEKEFWDIRHYKMQCVIVPSKLYNRELFNDVRFCNVGNHEDQALLIDIIPKCEKIFYSDKVIFFYRQREGSITHSKFDESSLNLSRALLAETHYFINRGWNELAFFSFFKGVRNLRDGYLLSKEGLFNEIDVLESMCEVYQKRGKEILSHTHSVTDYIKLMLFIHFRKLFFLMSSVKELRR